MNEQDGPQPGQAAEILHVCCHVVSSRLQRSDENDRSNVLGKLSAAAFTSCRNVPVLFTATVPIHVTVIYRLLSTGHVSAALR